MEKDFGFKLGWPPIGIGGTHWIPIAIGQPDFIEGVKDIPGV